MKRPTKEQIQALPSYTGLMLANIHIVETEDDAEKALAALNNKACLGFDTESKPTFRKGEVSAGPTLIQLSTALDAYLFPTRFPSAVSAAKDLLSNPEIKKVGFGLKGDNKELRSKLNIVISNTEDLSLTLKRIARERNPIGARAAVAMVLNARLGKGAQTSNWGAYPLKEHQILYAANDAHSAICIKIALNDGNKGSK